MTLDPDDPHLPLTRIERQRLRDIAERVRVRQERLSEKEAARARAGDIFATGPDGYRQRPRQHRAKAPGTAYRLKLPGD